MNEKELKELGEEVLNELIAALDIEQETSKTQRVRKTINRLHPFPQNVLLDQFKARDILAIQIKEVFKESTGGTAAFLVNQFFHSDKRIRLWVRQTLKEMPSDRIIPPLVEALSNQGWQADIAPYLLRYSDSIPNLVRELGTAERSNPAYATLLQFNSLDVIPYLMAGLQSSGAKQRTKELIVAIVKRERALFHSIIQLFDPAISRLISVSPEATQALQEVLTHELVDESLPHLIIGLKETQLREGCSHTLVMLAHQPGMMALVVEAVLHALKNEELRYGAKQTLVYIGQPALEPVSYLLDEAEQVEVAHEILSEMAPSLVFPFLYKLFHEVERIQDASIIFRRMSIKNVTEGLVHYLRSSDVQDIGMVLYLLYRRIDEEDRAYNVALIPALLKQAQQEEQLRLPIIAALLLFNGNISNRKSIAEHIVDSLYKQKEFHKEFLRIMPFIGGEQAVEALARIMNQHNAALAVRAEATGMLGIIRRDPRLESYVDALAVGTPTVPTMDFQTRQLNNPLYFRALGGLLASGNYDVRKLLQLLSDSPVQSTAFEFYSVLLGERYVPKVMALTTQLVEANENLRQLGAEIGRLNENIAFTNKQLDNVGRQNKDLTRSNQGLLEENRQLHDAESSLQRRINQLQRENNQLRSH